MDKSTFLWQFLKKREVFFSHFLEGTLEHWLSFELLGLRGCTGKLARCDATYQSSLPGPIGTPLVPHWYPIGTPLVPHWYPIGTPLVPHFGVPFWGDESNSRPTEDGRKYVHEARVMFRSQRCSHVEKIEGYGKPCQDHW